MKDLILKVPSSQPQLASKFQDIMVRLSNKSILNQFSNFSVNETSKRLMVRSCVLDSGSLTDETEIIRQSMCGKFLFDERQERDEN